MKKKVKVCSCCKKERVIKDFYKQNDRKINVKSQCKICIKKNYKADKQRDSQLKYRYNITLEQYDKMFEEQNGVCVICEQPNIANRRLCVDHNHATGKVRKLLCNKCNNVLALADENIDILLKAINYLRKYNE